MHVASKITRRERLKRKYCETVREFEGRKKERERTRAPPNYSEEYTLSYIPDLNAGHLAADRRWDGRAGGRAEGKLVNSNLYGSARARALPYKAKTALRNDVCHFYANDMYVCRWWRCATRLRRPRLRRRRRRIGRRNAMTLAG